MVNNLPHMRLKRATQKVAEATGDLISNKNGDKIMKLSKNSPQNNSEKVTNEHGEERTKKRYTSPEERQKIIDDLKLKL